MLDTRNGCKILLPGNILESGDLEVKEHMSFAIVPPRDPKDLIYLQNLTTKNFGATEA